MLRVESYAFCVYNTGRNYAVLIKWWLINIVLNICVFHFSVFIFFLIKKFLCVQARVWSSEDSSQGLGLSCHRVGSRDPTQVVRPTHKHLYLKPPRRGFLNIFLTCNTCYTEVVG